MVSSVTRLYSSKWQNQDSLPDLPTAKSKLYHILFTFPLKEGNWYPHWSLLRDELLISAEVLSPQFGSLPLSELRCLGNFPAQSLSQRQITRNRKRNNHNSSNNNICNHRALCSTKYLFHAYHPCKSLSQFTVRAIIPIYRWENWGSELKILSKVI